jgi:hypothetical protein
MGEMGLDMEGIHTTLSWQDSCKFPVMTELETASGMGGVRIFLSSSFQSLLFLVVGAI